MPTPDSSPKIDLPLKTPYALIVFWAIGAPLAVALVLASNHYVVVKGMLCLTIIVFCLLSRRATKASYRGRLLFDGESWYWLRPGPMGAEQQLPLKSVAAFLPFNRWLFLKFRQVPGGEFNLLLTPREVSKEQARQLRVLISTGYF